MCMTALPEHLNSKEEIENNFQDDSQFGDTWYGRLWKRWCKFVKPLTVFGPRDIHWYHRWREFPIVLFALFGRGSSRWESSGGELKVRAPANAIFWYNPNTVYLSRVQYWCRWSIQLQWPLFFAFHFYFKDNPYPTDTDGKLLFFYIGAHRDADKVYWCPSAYLGTNWK